MKYLEYSIKKELIALKDMCWEEERINKERIELYRKKVYKYKEHGYNVRIHELIIDKLDKRLTLMMKNQSNPKILAQKPSFSS